MKREGLILMVLILICLNSAWALELGFSDGKIFTSRMEPAWGSNKKPLGISFNGYINSRQSAYGEAMPLVSNEKEAELPQYAPGKVIVVVKPGIDSESIRKMVEEVGGSIKKEYHIIPAVLIEVPEGKECETIDLLKGRPEVEGAYLDRKVKVRIPEPVPITPPIPVYEK